MSQEYASLVLRHATVWTLEEHTPRAEAVAIRGNRILAVGKSIDMEPLIGPGTRVFDLAGHLVLPGFNDAHTHFIWAMLRLAGGLDLYGLGSLTEVQARLREYGQRNPGEGWILGWRWDPHRMGSRWPSRADLDIVEPRRPVAITDIDGHSCWLNSRALETIGYSRNTPDPEGGKIVRDDAGEPTGILLETARAPVAFTPAIPHAQLACLLRQEAAKLNRLGITSLSDNGAQRAELEVCSQLATEGLLTVRISEWPYLQDDLTEAEELRRRFLGNEKIRVLGLKGYLDGVLSARTAWMLTPYADAPGQSGFPVVAPEVLASRVADADARGFQVIIHAVGDRAVREALDLYERAAQANGRRDSRHRIEHAEVIHPQDQPRFGQLGVIASMTPRHCTSCIGSYIDERLGERRGAHSFAWRSLINVGTHLCFGSDWPTVDLPRPDPLEQIIAAVARSTRQGYSWRAWHPEQRLTVAQAIRSYTLEGAYAEFMEARKGSITAGKLADLCVLSRDILEGPTQSIDGAEVTMTVFDGQVVYMA